MSEADATAAAAELTLQRNAVSKLLSEYDRLDYEDDIGGLKTRFHYRSVGREDYGLSTDEILRLNDKELNQLVGLKRMAPYREDCGKFRPNYSKMKELRVAQDQKQQQWQQKQQHRQLQKQEQTAKAKKRRSHKEPAGPVPSVTAANAEPSAEAKAQRLKSFEKLSLKNSKPAGPSNTQAGAIKKAKFASVAPDDGAHAGLSKAARKNMKRAEKRAAKRTQSAAA